MDESQVALGISDPGEEKASILETQLDSCELGAVQPIQRLLISHFAPR
jgi:hypothetical protein